MSPTHLRDLRLGAVRVRTLTLVGLEAIIDAPGYGKGRRPVDRADKLSELRWLVGE